MEDSPGSYTKVVKKPTDIYRLRWYESIKDATTKVLLEKLKETTETELKKQYAALFGVDIKNISILEKSLTQKVKTAVNGFIRSIDDIRLIQLIDNESKQLFNPTDDTLDNMKKTEQERVSVGDFAKIRSKLSMTGYKALIKFIKAILHKPKKEKSESRTFLDVLVEAYGWDKDNIEEIVANGVLISQCFVLFKSMIKEGYLTLTASGATSPPQGTTMGTILFVLGLVDTTVDKAKYAGTFTTAAKLQTHIDTCIRTVYKKMKEYDGKLTKHTRLRVMYEKSLGDGDGDFMHIYAEMLFIYLIKDLFLVRTYEHYHKPAGAKGDSLKNTYVYYEFLLEQKNRLSKKDTSDVLEME